MNNSLDLHDALFCYQAITVNLPETYQTKEGNE